jgi:hypothetical protein
MIGLQIYSGTKSSSSSRTLDAESSKAKSESDIPEASLPLKKSPQTVGPRRGDLEIERLSRLSGDQQSLTPQSDTGARGSFE